MDIVAERVVNACDWYSGTSSTHTLLFDFEFSLLSSSPRPYPPIPEEGDTIPPPRPKSSSVPTLFQNW